MPLYGRNRSCEEKVRGIQEIMSFTQKYRATNMRYARLNF
jgi:hypothetical protein